MKTILAFTACFLCMPVGYSPALSANPVVSVRAIAPEKPLEAGKPAILHVELAISSPYHINSDRPLQDYLIPTALEFEPQSDVTFGKSIFPPAPIKKLPVLDTPMAVFEGNVSIAAKVIPSSSLKAEQVVIHGRVRYQACDDSTCLPPVWQSFSLALPVANPSPSPTSARSVSLPPEIPSSAQERESPPIPEKAGMASGGQNSLNLANKGLLITFVLVFLGGLALNLTPCVYPMIPITITYFGGQAQGKKGSLVLHSFLYVIGMAVTYSILGVVAAMTGGLFGAAHQYPLVLLGIALVMVLLALSMFDVYELRMPSFLNRLAGGSQKGFGGTLLMGLTVGIVAAPCIGPFVLGLLTYVGNKGNAVLGFALFFVLALGLGIPFLVLGMFSGSLHRLPRSGAWMLWVRKIFGFILLAMAVYFLKNLLPSLLAYHLTFALIMLLAGIYLAWIDPVPAAGKAFPYVRNIIGIIFFVVALYAAVSGLQASIGSMQSGIVGKIPSGAIQWLPYTEAMLDRASKEEKPVFIDFYADWCAPCKELDRHTFSVPEVVDRSRDFIMLKVDLTSAGDPQAEVLRKKYQARGVPTLVFLKPDGQEMADLRGTGFETKEVFLDKMNLALQRSADQKKPM